MIGFEAFVTNSAGHPITNWTARWDLPNEIQKLIDEGHAEVVKKTGGYPDTYKISKEYFCLWLLDSERMRMMYPCNKDNVHVRVNNLLDNEDTMLNLVLWDQS